MQATRAAEEADAGDFSVVLAITAATLLPLALAVFPLDELIQRLLGILF